MQIKVSKMSTKSLMRKLKPAIKRVQKENQSINGSDWSKYYYDRRKFQ